MIVKYFPFCFVEVFRLIWIVRKSWSSIWPTPWVSLKLVLRSFLVVPMYLSWRSWSDWLVSSSFGGFQQHREGLQFVVLRLSAQELLGCQGLGLCCSWDWYGIGLEIMSSGVVLSEIHWARAGWGKAARFGFPAHSSSRDSQSLELCISFWSAGDLNRTVPSLCWVRSTIWPVVPLWTLASSPEWSLGMVSMCRVMVLVVTSAVCLWVMTTETLMMATTMVCCLLPLVMVRSPYLLWSYQWLWWLWIGSLVCRDCLALTLLGPIVAFVWLRSMKLRATGPLIFVVLVWTDGSWPRCIGQTVLSTFVVVLLVRAPSIIYKQPFAWHCFVWYIKQQMKKINILQRQKAERGCRWIWWEMDHETPIRGLCE